MQIWEAVYLAMTQIRAEKLKSFFSLLGVVIGVMFLVTVVSVVEGIDRYMTEDFADALFGVNTVTLRRTPEFDVDSGPEERRRRARHPYIRFEDADALREKLTVPARVGVESRTTRDVTADNGTTASNVSIVAASSEIFEIRDWQVERGRVFSAQEAERGVPVAVLGSETAEVLFANVDPIGRSVRVRGFPYRVIGVLESQGSLFGQSLDGTLVVPVRSPIRAVTNPGGIVGSVFVQTLDPDRLRDAENEVVEIMRIRRRLRPAEPHDFAVETAESALGFWEEISRVLYIALPGLVGVSLVVGGIVIMNIMLVSVMERTREIGVRKAVGARRRDIILQVLIEAATLSTLGASIGAAAGVAISSTIAALSPLPTEVAPRWIAFGLLLGVSVGLVAGVYPAARASELDPVDALRYE